MKAKLIIDGREFPIEIQDPELKKLLDPKKKTGYERCKLGETYYLCTDGMSEACDFKESGDIVDDGRYERATYYSDPTVAENNARADKLMRQLRRFAVEHRESDIVWDNVNITEKYCIRFGHGDWSMWADTELLGQEFGMIIFDSKEACNLAIETFHDELIWYFTEYKDSL